MTCIKKTLFPYKSLPEPLLKCGCHIIEVDDFDSFNGKELVKELKRTKNSNSKMIIVNQVLPNDENVQEN